LQYDARRLLQVRAQRRMLAPRLSRRVDGIGFRYPDWTRFGWRVYLAISAADPVSKRMVLERLLMDLTTEPKLETPGWMQEHLPV
jgi:hypothetical protein